MTQLLNRKLRMGMIGGGPGAFIGAIHRTAAQMDGLIELSAGVFSSDGARSKEMGASLFLPPHRVYQHYQEMFAAEKALPAGERIDFVSIVTPNHLHFAPAEMALQNGFPVVMDKPMTFDLDEAKKLAALVHQTKLPFCLTHTYAGYPMVKEARQQVASGPLGTVRKLYATYPQGWLNQRLENTDQKQAAWRTDPQKSGKAGSMGDIGTHAFHLLEYISGLKVTAVCAQINTVVEGRRLDDDGAVLLQFDNGATGLLVASQVLSGEENNLSVQVYGDEAGLSWQHADCNSLLLRRPGQAVEVLRAGNDYLSEAAKHNSRTPSGHPEGFIEAFANHYRNFALTLSAIRAGATAKAIWQDFPGVEDGVRGMAFIDAVIASGNSQQKWTSFSV